MASAHTRLATSAARKRCHCRIACSPTACKEKPQTSGQHAERILNSWNAKVRCHHCVWMHFA